MIEHMVLFKLRADAPAGAGDRMLERLRGLRGSSAGMLELTCGVNFSARSQGFTHGLLVRFKSRADLEAYAVDPEHQKVIAEAIRPVAESVLALDYEV